MRVSAIEYHSAWPLNVMTHGQSDRHVWFQKLEGHVDARRRGHRGGVTTDTVQHRASLHSSSALRLTCIGQRAQIAELVKGAQPKDQFVFYCQSPVNHLLRGDIDDGYST